LEEEVGDGGERVGQGVEESDQVALESDECVRRAGGHEQAEQDEQDAHDQVEHVGRGAHVLVGRRFVDDGVPGVRRRRRLLAAPVPARRVRDCAEHEDDDGDDRVARGSDGDGDFAHGRVPGLRRSVTTAVRGAVKVETVAALSWSCLLVMRSRARVAARSPRGESGVPSCESPARRCRNARPLGRRRAAAAAGLSRGRC
jgi:hypothetical protein